MDSGPQCRCRRFLQGPAEIERSAIGRPGRRRGSRSSPQPGHHARVSGRLAGVGVCGDPLRLGAVIGEDFRSTAVGPCALAGGKFAVHGRAGYGVNEFQGLPRLQYLSSHELVPYPKCLIGAHRTQGRRVTQFGVSTEHGHSLCEAPRRATQPREPHQDRSRHLLRTELRHRQRLCLNRLDPVAKGSAQQLHDEERVTARRGAASLDKPHVAYRAELAPDQLANCLETQRLEPNRARAFVLGDRRGPLFTALLRGPRRRDHKHGKLGDTTC